MDKGTQTMIENLQKNTGKSLEEWITITKSQQFVKHGEMLKFLKEEHGLTHGFANLIALKTKGTDAESKSANTDLVSVQYQGKEDLKKIYDKLISQIQEFGDDIEVSPKNAYVSLRRKKQFATLQPATKTRFEIGINLKGVEGKGILQPISTANAMCSHKINITSITELDEEVIGWLKAAYIAAG
ncbi:MAG: DUF4287 domain-containing protein [Chryseobacterium sp.]|nr:MAG: DUF4287 domain-containing protein [Chryseobacterium sp.]